MTPAYEQSMRALERANEARFGAADVKREVAAGELPVSRALWDHRGQSMTVYDLLVSQWEWGPKRARKLLALLQIPELKRIRALTERQRRMIADICR